jgi:hypothetical protein
MGQQMANHGSFLGEYATGFFELERPKPSAKN